MSNTKVIHLQRPYGTLEKQRDEVAAELRAKGYLVDSYPFTTTVFVNGWSAPCEGKRINMLTEAEAQAVIDMYKEQKVYSPNGYPSGTVNINVVFWKEEEE